MQKILLVDDDKTLLSSMGEFFEAVLGMKCILLTGLADIVAQEAEILDRDVKFAILDINLGQGQPSGIDVYQWLCDHHFQGKCVFLTGHAKDHPLVKNASLMKGVHVFEKPLEIDQLISLIKGQPLADVQAG